MHHGNHAPVWRIGRACIVFPLKCLPAAAFCLIYLYITLVREYHTIQHPILGLRAGKNPSGARLSSPAPGCPHTRPLQPDSSKGLLRSRLGSPRSLLLTGLGDNVWPQLALFSPPIDKCSGHPTKPRLSKLTCRNPRANSTNVEQSTCKFHQC